MSFSISPCAASPAVAQTASAAPSTASVSNHGQQARCFLLEGRLEFDTAADALQALQRELLQAGHTTLDLGGITAANSAGLAVLLECKAMVRKSGNSVSFENIPDSLQKIAEVCQVQDLLA